MDRKSMTCTESRCALLSQSLIFRPWKRRSRFKKSCQKRLPSGSLRNTLIASLLLNGKKSWGQAKNTLQGLAMNAYSTRKRFTSLVAWMMMTEGMTCTLSTSLLIIGTKWLHKEMYPRRDLELGVLHSMISSTFSGVTQSKVQNIMKISSDMISLGGDGRPYLTTERSQANALIIPWCSMGTVYLSLEVTMAKTGSEISTNAR